MNIIIELTQEEVDELAITWPGGLLATPSEFLQDAIDESRRRIEYAWWLRRETAMSGSMRWPWSHEFKMEIGGPPRGV